MSVSEDLRRVIRASGETHYRISKETGINTRALDRFVNDGKHIRTNTVDKLCVYFGLELRPIRKRPKSEAEARRNRGSRRTRKT